MIKTPQPYQDFLSPDHCIYLFGLGLTDATKFYWMLDKSNNLATLRYKTTTESENPKSKIPAYSVSCLISLFPDVLIARANSLYEVYIPKDPTITVIENQKFVTVTNSELTVKTGVQYASGTSNSLDSYSTSEKLNEALFIAVSSAIQSGHYSLQTLNLGIHQFNTNEYEY